jgi:co-chaperonin GroES (HSP10)
MQTIKLIGDKIAVRLLGNEQLSSILIIPNQHVEIIRRAFVYIVGDNLSEDIGIGHTVIVDVGLCLSKFHVSGQEYRLFNTKDVLAIISN